MTPRTLFTLAALMGGVLQFTTAQAADTTVEMLNEKDGTMMAFSTPLVMIEAGDTVTWKATHKTHSVAFVNGGTPDGVAPLTATFNQDAQYTFQTPGMYLYKCPAHYGMGMIGLVVVGQKPTNVEAIKQLSLMPAAKKRLTALLAQYATGNP